MLCDCSTRLGKVGADCPKVCCGCVCKEEAVRSGSLVENPALGGNDACPCDMGSCASMAAGAATVYCWSPAMRSSTRGVKLHYTLCRGVRLNNELPMISLFTIEFRRSSASRRDARGDLERVTLPSTLKRQYSPSRLTLKQQRSAMLADVPGWSFCMNKCAC